MFGGTEDLLGGDLLGGGKIDTKVSSPANDLLGGDLLDEINLGTAPTKQISDPKPASLLDTSDLLGITSTTTNSSNLLGSDLIGGDLFSLDSKPVVG